MITFTFDILVKRRIFIENVQLDELQEAIFDVVVAHAMDQTLFQWMPGNLLDLLKVRKHSITSQDARYHHFEHSLIPNERLKA